MGATFSILLFCLFLSGAGACGGGGGGAAKGGDGGLPGGDESGRWQTVGTPLAQFPEQGVYEEHVEFDDALFILHRVDGSGRLVRYGNSGFEMVPDNDAAYFGADLTVHDGALYLSYVLNIGGGSSRLAVARLGSSGFEVLDGNVSEVALRDVPRGGSSGGTLHWMFSERQEVGAFVGRYGLLTYDGVAFELVSFEPPDAAYNGSPHMFEDAGALYVVIESGGLLSGDYTNPFKVYRLEGNALVSEFTVEASPDFVQGAPVLRDGSVYVTEGQGGLGLEVVRYDKTGDREVLVNEAGFVYGPVRASNLGPTWVKYYTGSVDNRYSRGQYYDVTRGVVVDLPYRFPDGVSQPGGSSAEDYLFGISEATAEYLVAFSFQGQLHMIVNAISGVGEAGNPSDILLMRFDEG